MNTPMPLWLFLLLVLIVLVVGAIGVLIVIGGEAIERAQRQLDDDTERLP